MAAFGQWQFECDLEATRMAYARADQGGAESCTCNACRNFVAAKKPRFSKSVSRTLDNTGHRLLEGRRNISLRPTSLPDTTTTAGGFILLVSYTLTGISEWSISGMDSLLGYARRAHQDSTTLESLPAVQLEFHAEAVPWVLFEPEAT